MSCPSTPSSRAGQLAQLPGASVGFQAVPWGTFDLGRMRVTDLAAGLGRALSLSPGLGRPCRLPAPGTPGGQSGLRGHGGVFLTSLPPLCPPQFISWCVHPLHSPLQRGTVADGAGGRALGAGGERVRVLPFQEAPARTPRRGPYVRQTEVHVGGGRLGGREARSPWPGGAGGGGEGARPRRRGRLPRGGSTCDGL